MQHVLIFPDDIVQEEEKKLTHVEIRIFEAHDKQTKIPNISMWNIKISMPCLSGFKKWKVFQSAKLSCASVNKHSIANFCDFKELSDVKVYNDGWLRA